MKNMDRELLIMALEVLCVLVIYAVLAWEFLDTSNYVQRGSTSGADTRSSRR